jgi:hypothetical protein
MAMAEYERHYDEYIECDLCGQQTRGRIYDDARSKVVCGACHGELLESVVRMAIAPWERLNYE